MFSRIPDVGNPMSDPEIQSPTNDPEILSPPTTDIPNPSDSPEKERERRND